MKLDFPDRGRILRQKKRFSRGKISRKRSYTLPSLLLMGQRPRRTKKRVPLVSIFLCLLGLVLAYALVDFLRERDLGPVSHPLRPYPTTKSDWRPSPDLLAEGLDRLSGATCIELSDGRGPSYYLYTSLDSEYQRWVEGRLHSSMALGGVVAVLDPPSGRILALAVYNENPEAPEAFFWRAYPAASLFKIVTAAAALEKGGLEPDSVMTYTGRKHTLYNRDLKEKAQPWSNRMTLREAFALSVNPVFGKIGIHSLGKEVIREYGAAFFFGQALPCEVPFETSRLHVPDDPLGIAEIASGFNRRTLMTALHAAWVAALIASDGSAPVPWLVESAEAVDGEEIYRREEGIPIRVLSPATARKMQDLMEATMRTGTCRKSFRARKQDRRLQSVVFGGKTGNINDAKDTIKYDWFVGYARDTETGHAVASSVLMIHGRRLGHLANVMAFDIFRRHLQKRSEERDLADTSP